MKRLILAGLCCVMLAGCTNANSDSISEGEVHLGEVLDQTGHSFSYMASGYIPMAKGGSSPRSGR